MDKLDWAFLTDYRPRTKLVLLALVHLANHDSRGRVRLGVIEGMVREPVDMVMNSLMELAAGGHLATEFDKYEGVVPGSDTAFSYTLYPKGNRPATI